MTEEGKLQSEILNYLIKEAGWMCNKLITMSHSGWPDIVAIKNGITIFIEVKKLGEKPDPIQDYIIRQLNKNGVISFYVDKIQSLYDKLNELNL